ncbi:MAG: hypothetical protein FWG94_07755, partial [Oscillospiraceae bacterium]|nr:hypothetical protein [Oscillospiraceae bacterium]
RDVEISGTTGAISGGLGGINANLGDVKISGTTGQITGGDFGIQAFGGVAISGEVGVISGGNFGIYFVNGTFNISNNSVVYASSVETWDGDFIPALPDASSQGILFIGDEGTVYGDVILGDNLTINSDETLTVPDGASLTIPRGVTLTNNGTITNDGTIRNNGTIQNDGTIQNNGTIHSRAGGFGGNPPEGNPVRYSLPSSNIDRGSSSSSGGGTTQAAAAPANAPVNITQAVAMTATQNAITAARAAGSTVATVNFKNPGDISLSTLQAMANAARQAGMTLRLQADSMTADNRSVDVRITLNPAQSTQDLNLSASTTNAGATRTTNTFTRFFGNNVMTVSLGQQGGFGQTVTIAAKLNPGLNTDNLAFYVYDRTANTFRRIQSPNYRVDANGYVHFDTAMGGEIVISDGALSRR